MSKFKKALYWSVYEAILGVLIYIQYGDMLDKINNKTYEIALFFIFFISLSVSCFVITYISVQIKKFVVDKMDIFCIVMGGLIYAVLTCYGVYSILEYSKDDKMLKIVITVLCNVSTTVMVYRHNKKEVI